ncbi:cysteine desulfurase family protein [Microlunatus flavus]|uniref:cysteine desulfurase family protein n=1 Tax=Microlunatus flavus TaxID=1036181 RepID=UPI0022B769A6|nr:cysteine desulfurase family protein [Microlunatus flavus]
MRSDPDRSPADRSYLDHAATTPMRAEAVAAVTAELTRTGNPSSAHGSGRAARRVVEDARELIAARLGADPAEVVLTGGGTEADNLAVKGAYWARRDADRRDVLVSAVEHHAVGDAALWLAQTQGAQVTLLPVDAAGRLDLDAYAAALGPRSAVVSVMWANNEVGTVQPVRAVAEAGRAAGAVVHSDAVQAVGHVPVDFAASGLDLLSLTAHKLGGPVGVGALLARRSTALAAVQHGGGQERDVRSGTLDVVGVAGFAAAVDVAVRTLQEEAAREVALREELFARVRAAVPDASRHGASPDDPAAGLPGVLSVQIPGAPGDAVVMLLDAAGVDASTGSACSAGVTAPSHVLTALGVSEAEARSVVRFSLGHTTTAADLDRVSAVLPDVVARARAAAAYV